LYPAESDIAHRFLKCLRSGGLSHRERPDFEDTAASLLLEAMVVDDHPRPGKKDKTRAREGAVLRELREAGLDVRPDVSVFAAVSSGLPTDRDHNYRAYVDQFTRTVLNHAGKAEVYRAERPGFDLGFLVFDESTAYFETLGAFGPPGMGRPHWWFADSAFADALQRGLRRLADAIQEHACGRQWRVPAPDDDDHRGRPVERGGAPRLRRMPHGFLRRVIPVLQVLRAQRTGN